MALQFGSTGSAVKSGTEEKVTDIKLFSEKDADTLTETPVIRAGYNLYITVETGSEGSANRAYIFKKGLTRDKRIADVNVCYSTSSCMKNRVKTAKYRTSTSWEEGTYYVSIKDYMLSNQEGKEVFVSSEFTLVK